MGKPYGRVPKEVPVCREISGLAPKFRDKIERVLERMVNAGHEPFIFETHRTSERQQFLYGFGRAYDDGRGLVTYSHDARDTWHGYWLAVDIICRRKYWNAPDRFWADLGAACAAEGLCWGDDWDGDGIRTGPDNDEDFSDRPHVQWKPMRRKPSLDAQRLFKEGGYRRVWQEVGAV